MNYVLYGEERYLMQQQLQRILKENAIDDFNDVVRYDATKHELYQILEDASTIPFFQAKKIILVEQALFLTSQMQSQWNLDVLIKYLCSPLDTTILIFTVEAEKLDARKKVVKTMQKTCKVLRYQRLNNDRKQYYIDSAINEKNIKIESRARAFLYARLPSQLVLLYSELDKLALYDEEITLSLLQKLVTRELSDDVFLLVDAVVNQEMNQALTIFEDLLALKYDPIYLIALLAGQLRFLFQVCELMKLGKLKEEIIAVSKAHPYRVQVSMDTCKQQTPQKLLDLLARLAILDQKMKTGVIDKQRGFELFILQSRNCYERM